MNEYRFQMNGFSGMGFYKGKDIALFPHNADGMEFVRRDESEERIADLEAQLRDSKGEEEIHDISMLHLKEENEKLEATRVSDELLDYLVDKLDGYPIVNDKEERNFSESIRATQALRKGTEVTG